MPDGANNVEFIDFGRPSSEAIDFRSHCVSFYPIPYQISSSSQISGGLHVMPIIMIIITKIEFQQVKFQWGFVFFDRLFPEP